MPPPARNSNGNTNGGGLVGVVRVVDVLPAAALAPLPALGVVLVGCQACRHPVGVASIGGSAPGVDAAMAAHLAVCRTWRPNKLPPPQGWVCGRCYCEAEVTPRRDGTWVCGDCLAEQLLHDLDLGPDPAIATPLPTPAATAPAPRSPAHQVRQGRGPGRPPDPAEAAVGVPAELRAVA